MSRCACAVQVLFANCRDTKVQKGAEAAVSFCTEHYQTIFEENCTLRTCLPYSELYATHLFDLLCGCTEY